MHLTERDLAPLKFDRRRSPRSAMEVRATAFVLGGAEFGRLLDLRVVDCGHDGAGMISDAPISPGTIVSIGFDRPGMLARRAEVSWCTPCGRGYRLGVRYQGRLAA